LRYSILRTAKGQRVNAGSCHGVCTRRLYSVETHRAVMQWVLKILRKHGLAQGQSVCIDATTPGRCVAELKILSSQQTLWCHSNPTAVVKLSCGCYFQFTRRC
jgi:hypothetical protein